MSEPITRKIDAATVSDPLGRAADDDPWRHFREVERIELNLHYEFRHSLGKVSRFFLELENRRLMATRCPVCGKVWMPPRPLCADDMSITQWLELPGRGVLEAASVSAYHLEGGGHGELALGYVRLHGADTMLLQRLRNYSHTQALVPGLPVQVAWTTTAVAHPMETFWFEPA